MSLQPSVDPRIIERLRHAEDVAARLNTQLQQLAGLSHNDLNKFRTRMLNPDIAIPLLQCYDATIEEKTNEVEELRNKLRTLQNRADSIGSDRVDVENQLKVANLQIQEMLHAERTTQEQSNRGLFAQQNEIAVLRMQLAEANEQRASLLTRTEKDATAVKALQERLAEQSQKLDDALTALHTAKKTVDHARQSDAEGQSQFEAQRIQLVLTSKENDDKVHEIERLRTKMGQMLKQSEDNHVAHLRIIEEKHKQTIDALREEIRAQELAVLRLRAQLSRVDVLAQNGVGGGALAHTGGPRTSSTVDLLESQARQAQELEVKRLNAELTSAVMLRDEALFRLDQTQQHRKQDYDDRLGDAKRDGDMLRARVQSAEERAERLQRELAQALEHTRSLKEKLKTAVNEAGKVGQDRDAALAKADEAKKLLAAKDEALQQAVHDKDEAAEAVKHHERQAERRIDDVRREAQLLKDRIAVATTDTERLQNTLKRENKELTHALQAAQAAVRDRDREVEALNSKIGWLLKGLTQHKAQLVECDQRLQGYAQQELATRGEFKELVVQLANSKMELARCVRDRDRLTAELNRRHY